MTKREEYNIKYKEYEEKVKELNRLHRAAKHYKIEQVLPLERELTKLERQLYQKIMYGKFNQ